MGVRIQGTIRKEAQEYNGLESIATALEKAGTRRWVVAEVETVGYEVDFGKGGVHSPKVRFTRIEPLADQDALTARKLADEAYSERTGQAAPSPTLFDEPDGPDDQGGEGEVYTRAGIIPGHDQAPEAPADGADSEGPWPGDVDAPADPDTAATEG